MKQTRYNLIPPRVGDPVSADLHAAIVEWIAGMSRMPQSAGQFQSAGEDTKRTTSQFRDMWFRARTDEETDIPVYSLLEAYGFEVADDGELVIVVGPPLDPDVDPVDPGSLAVLCANEQYVVTAQGEGYVRIVHDGGVYLGRDLDDYAWLLNSRRVKVLASVDANLVDGIADVDYFTIGENRGVQWGLFYLCSDDLLGGGDPVDAVALARFDDYAAAAQACASWTGVADLGTACGAFTDTETLSPQHFFGVAFGRSTNDASPAPTVHGDVVVAVKVCGTWYAVGCGAPTAEFELKETLCGCFAAVLAWRVVSGPRRTHDDATYTLHTRQDFAGLLPGTDDLVFGTPPDAGAVVGSRVQATWDHRHQEWRVTGSGYTAVRGDYDGAGGVEVTPALGCSLADTFVVALDGDTSDLTTGDEVLAVWDGGCAFYRVKEFPGVGCGLEVDSEDGGKIRLADIAGDGTTWDVETCKLSLDCEAVKACIEDELPEGCTVADLCTRVDALEVCCTTLTDLVDVLTDRIEDLEECCDDSRECCEQAMLCCYENREAIDYIGEYCCDGGLDDGGGGCAGKCVWRWLGATWELIVPCAGSDDCNCEPPAGDGVAVGDLEFTDCFGTSQQNGCECCDPECIPNSLTATFSGSGCAELDAETVPLTGEDNVWTGSKVICGDNYEVIMVCNNEGALTTTLKVNGVSVGAVDAETADCEGVSFSFPGFAHSPSCEGCEMSTEVSITITQ